MEGRVPNGGRRREAEKQEHNSVQRTDALRLPKFMAQNRVQTKAFTKTDTSAIMTATNHFRTSGRKGCEAYIETRTRTCSKQLAKKKLKSHMGEQRSFLNPDGGW